MRSRLILAVLIAIAFAAIMATIGWPEEIPLPTPVLDFLPKDRVLVSGVYAYEINPATHTARWVAERLTPAITKGPAVRNESFFVDPNLPRELRINGTDYEHHPQIDVGHLAASHNYGMQLLQRQTFCYSNTAPQNSVLNRGAWARIEAEVLGLVEEDRVVYVVTGPVFAWEQDQKPALVGRTLMPTSFFKAVLVEERGKPKWMYGYLAPNEDPGTKTKADLRCTVRQIEEVALLDLFAWVAPKSLQDKLETER